MTTSSPAEGRPAHGQPRHPEVRERILHAATELFARVGFHGTTTRAVCARAGVPLGSLHYYFGGKEALYVAVVESLLEREAELLTAIERELRVPEAAEWGIRRRLERVLELWVDFHFEHPEIARIGLHRVAEHGLAGSPLEAPPVLPAGRSVAEILARLVGAPRTREYRARMMAANDLIAGFVGGASHHAHALGVDPGSLGYRRLVERTVLDLIVANIKEDSHGSEL
jgi:AcrR family transcriptional regulator